MPTSASCSISLVLVLPTLPVTATICACDARARRAAQVFERLERIVARRAAAPACCHRRSSAAKRWRARHRALSAAATKSWPSRLSPLIATKISPGATRAAVDRDAGECCGGLPRACRRSPRRFVDGPQWLSHDSPRPRPPRATASWSLNGNTVLPTIWPSSWPLPATSSTSPAASASTAVRIARARSPISIAALAAPP